MDFNLTQFEFLRPDILWLMLPACLLIAFVWFKKQKNGASQTVIASHLAQFIMSDAKKQAKPNLIWLILFLLISILAAAGPSWQKHTIPVYQAKHARVLVMDMSSSMYSTDIKPNRLSQARFKTLDMVELFKEGETALIAYAGSAFTISPLTSDAQTLANLIPSLSPDIMPEKGSNVLGALALAKELLQQAGYLNGDIILVTDGIDDEDMADVSDFMSNMDYKLNIYAVATEQGAPIKLPQSGFLKDQYGQIVIPKANFSALKNMTKKSSGLFSIYQTSNKDITVFNTKLSKDDLQKQLVEQDQQTLWRIDGGIYLMFLLLPIALLMLRQNNALFVVAIMVIVAPSKQAYAFTLDDVWQSLSQNKAQKALKALKAYQNKDYKNAVNTELKDIKGAAHYKEDNFEAALSEFSQDNSATGLYNQGNTLAHLGKYKEAIDKYEQSLSLNSDFSQAKDNLQLVKQLEQQEKQKQQGDDQNKEGDQDKKSQDDQQGEGDKSEQDQEQKENSDKNDSDKKDSQKDSQKSESDEEDSEQSDNAQNSNEQNKPELETEPNSEQEKQQEAQENPAEEPQEEPAQQTEEQKAAQQQAEEDDAKQAKEEMAMREAPELSNEEKEKAQQLNQILRKVPDDPATLLRNKMRLEYQNRLRQRTPQGVKKSW